MVFTRVTLALSIASCLTAGAALLSGCGSDCAQTLTCGTPKNTDGGGGIGGAPGTGGSTGGMTSGGGTSSVGGSPGTGGMGGDPGMGGMGGAPMQPIAIGLGWVQILICNGLMRRASLTWRRGDARVPAERPG